MSSFAESYAMVTLIGYFEHGCPAGNESREESTGDGREMRITPVGPQPIKFTGNDGQRTAMPLRITLD
jgi:hypothetical protein